MVFALSKTQFDNLMLKNNITIDNIETKNFCVISINNTTDRNKPYFESEKNNLKILYFDDVSVDIKECKTFTQDQAIDLFDFIEANKDKVSFIIHCSAGISRSGAVAQFINDYFDFDKEKFKLNNQFIHPNPHVFSLLKNVWNKKST